MPPLYRYIATARQVEAEWVMVVSDFPGEIVVPSAEQATLPELGAAHVARALGVKPSEVTVLVNHYRSNPDKSWQDRAEFHPKGAYEASCHVFEGGTVVEAVAAFSNWVNSMHDDFEAGVLKLGAVTFRYDPTQRLGDAPVELDVYFERHEADLAPSALPMASRVVAALAAEGVIARIAAGSTGDRAWIFTEHRPDVGFVVEPQEENRAWCAAVPMSWAEGTEPELGDDAAPVGEEVDSPLDGLGVQTPPLEVAAAIQRFLAQPPPVEP